MLIWLQDVRADLATPGCLALLATDLVDVIEALLPGPLGQPSAVLPSPSPCSATGIARSGRRPRPRWGMGYPDRRIRGVDVLAPGPL